MITPYIHEISTPITPKNSVSITFDDGPHPRYTEKILDILKEKNVKATFFVIGNHIPKREKILQREIREGHTIGNHSFTHVHFPKISSERIILEVLYTNIEILKNVGKYPYYFRFPYGDEDGRIDSIYHGAIIGWNVDAYDWKEKNPNNLAKNILHQTKDGSIILLHDIKEDTVKALPLIIDGLRKKGYHIVPLQILLHKATMYGSKGIVYTSRYNKAPISRKGNSQEQKSLTSENILLHKDSEIINNIATW